MLNVTKMLDMIRQNPGIRTVQLSDKLDCEIEQLNSALDQNVESGEIVRHQVIAPNGHKAAAFTTAGVPLPKTAVPASAISMMVADLTKPAKQEHAQVKPKTNVEKAVDFIAANGGKATSAQLHSLLGLEADAYPSQYLASAIKSGRLVKDGKFWMLGAGSAEGAELRKSATSVDESANQHKTKVDETEEKHKTASAPSSAVEKPEVTPVAAEPVKVPQFLKKAATPSAPAPQQTAEVEKPAAAPEYLKIRMIEEPTFTIQLGHVSLPGMRQVSEWNGIKELRDSQGRVLIVLTDDGPFVRMFDAILGKKEQDITVIKGHPDLIYELAAAIQPERKAA